MPSPVIDSEKTNSTAQLASFIMPSQEGEGFQTEQRNSGPNKGRESSGIILEDLSALFLNDLKAMFITELQPRALSIENELHQLQYEAEQVSSNAALEHEQVLKELTRLSSLVLSFQDRIQQFLVLGGGVSGIGT